MSCYSLVVSDELLFPVVIDETDGDVINIRSSNQFQNVIGCSRSIDNHVLHFFRDLYIMDDLVRVNNLAKMIVFYKAGVYQGSLWYLYDENHIVVFGIRSSIQNYILNVKGTLRFMISKIKEMSDKKKILILSPPSEIEPFLLKIGYNETRSSNEFIKKCRFTSTVVWQK